MPGRFDPIAEVPDGVVSADDRLHIVIDTREPVGKGWTFEPKQVVVSRATLSEGDYTVKELQGRVVLERKALGDLVQTVIQNWLRFRKELIRLSAYDCAAIVVEADMSDIWEHRYESEALPASVIGKMNTIMIDHAIPVLLWGRDKRVCSDLAHRFLLLAWKKYHDR